MGCWGGGGAVAVMEKRRGRAGAGDGYDGCYGAEAALLRAKKEARKMKNGRWALWATAGELKARPGQPGRGGQGTGDARRPLASTRCTNSAWCRPLNLIAVHSVKQQRCLTMGFSFELSPDTKPFSE